MNFINSLNDGTVSIHLLDLQSSYVKKGTFKGQKGRHENFVFQYTHEPCTENAKGKNTCLGSTKKDMAEFLITGIDKVLKLKDTTHESWAMITDVYSRSILITIIFPTILISRSVCPQN